MSTMSGLLDVMRERGREVERSVELLGSLLELRKMQELANRHALDLAIDAAREDAESAVIMWSAARAELWSMASHDAAAARKAS